MDEESENEEDVSASPWRREEEEVRRAQDM